MSPTASAGARGDAGSHPLDLIPLFRRQAPSLVRDLLYTAIWNTMIAVVLTALHLLSSGRSHPILHYLLPALLVSNLIGFMIHGSLLAGDLVLRGWPGRSRGLTRMMYHVAVVSVCVVLGLVLGDSILRGRSPAEYLIQLSALASLLPLAVFVAIFMFIVLLTGERRIVTERQAAQQREELAHAAQLLAESQLRALYAQIEPHFLYNTLANVVGLIDTDPAQARQLLERFIDYLRGTLAASRAEHSTLGAEADLLAAYLDVLSVRMGPRLRYQIDIPGDCRALRIAPMLLQPVVENAVIHGLEPKIEGGHVSVQARLDGPNLMVAVSDSGGGLRPIPSKPGGGVGMANLRSRLESMYGDEASVEFVAREPCGITVRITIPATWKKRDNHYRLHHI